MHVEYKVVTRTAVDHVSTEDAYKVAYKPGKSFIATVADGHGKKRFAKEISTLSMQVACDMVREFSDRQNTAAFLEICNVIQRRVACRYGKKAIGAVATCIVADEKNITIAQVGDCVVLKFTPQEHRFVARLTEDHAPDRPSEIVRLRPIYAQMEIAPVIRDMESYCITHLIVTREKGKGATAAFSRSFGDPDFLPAVIHVPEVKSVDYTSYDELYAVCSDGGEDTVRLTFRKLFDQKVLMDDRFMNTVDQIANEQMPQHPDDDITIIFFRITRNSPTL